MVFTFKKVLNTVQRWQFNENEKLLLDGFNKNKQSEKSKTNNITVVFQTPPLDYYHLALYALTIKEIKKNNSEIQIIGLWPEIVNLKHPRWYFFYPFVFSTINNFFLKRKWKKLYYNIGIQDYVYLNKISFYQKVLSLIRAFKIFKSIRSKNDLLKLEIDQIKCGDLIYDTFLRFRVKATVDISNFHVFYFIYLSLNIIKSSEKIKINYSPVDKYFTSYSTYINHGIIVRYFLREKISVYSSGNLQQRFKKLDINDHYHTANFKNYKSTFDSYIDKQPKIFIAKSFLNSKFSGVIDRSMSYMKATSFANNSQNQYVLNNTIEGVLFLHDFFDSPHIYDDLLFNDFHEWVYHTLSLITDNNLNIAVKPHPNQISDSEKIINFFKIQFPNILWINSSVSNSYLLNSHIKFGISVYGTVLHELAYHRKLAISAGSNPHSSFDFALKPKDLKQYDEFILNYTKYIQPEVDWKEEVEKFYYMHNLANTSAFEIDDKPLAEFNVINSTSDIIKNIMPYLTDKN